MGAVYGALGAGDRFRNVLYPDVGHTYTPAMRRRGAGLARPLAHVSQHTTAPMSTSLIK